MNTGMSMHVTVRSKGHVAYFTNKWALSCKEQIQNFKSQNLQGKFLTHLKTGY